MINCCIERLPKTQRDGTPLSTSSHSLRQRIPSSSSLNSSFTNILNPKIPSSENVSKTFESENVDAVLINSFNSISTDDLPSIDPSASVILVGNNSDIFSNSASVTSSPSSAVFPVPSRMDKHANPTQSPTINDLIFIEKEMINDVEVTGALDYQNNRSAAQLQLTNSSPAIGNGNGNGNAFSPTPSSFSEHSDPNPNSLLTDSFVQLSYSSSSESIPGFDCGYGSSKPGSNGSISINENSSEVIDEHVREGHLYMLSGVRLQKTGEPVWIPETQEAGLLTEDMVREQEEFLANLGCSESASRKRAEIQSSCLKSDMEAFKAANPHATLEDFVRWHSPRDWIPDGGDDPDKGRLSPRMLKEGNFWQNLWERARRVPVSRQKPLFDYLDEGEKALKYLEEILIDDLFVQLLPTMFLIAYDTLASHSIAREIRPVTLGLAELAQALTRFSWTETELQNTACANIIAKFRENEKLMGKAISLLRKLPKQFHLVERIITETETQVRDGKEREAVYDLFASGVKNSSFPHPTTREFILRATTTDSISISPRMYVLINMNGMRMSIVDKVEDSDEQSQKWEAS